MSSYSRGHDPRWDGDPGGIGWPLLDMASSCLGHDSLLGAVFLRLRRVYNIGVSLNMLDGSDAPTRPYQTGTYPTI